MFRAFQDKGFQISFANGLTISIMFGKGNYCEHRYAPENSPNGSVDAEFAVWETSTDENPRGPYVFADGIEGTGHTGWVSPDNIAKAIAIVAGHKQDEPRADLVAKLYAIDP